MIECLIRNRSEIAFIYYTVGNIRDYIIYTSMKYEYIVCLLID